MSKLSAIVGLFASVIHFQIPENKECRYALHKTKGSIRVRILVHRFPQFHECLDDI